MLMDRRALVTRLGSLIIGAPAIVRASSLMPMKSVDWTPLASHVNEIRENGKRPWAGWVERVSYQMMDHVLKTGWTPAGVVVLRWHV
jgi:hypothetical protein